MYFLDHTSPEVPPREKSVLRYVLDQQAEETPDKPFVIFHDGTQWTYAEALAAARKAAAGLQAQGVKKGDVVFVWLPNGKEFLQAWFGANYIGAVVAAANTAYKGGILEHIITLIGAKVGIVHKDLMNRLGDISLGGLKQIFEVGGSADVDLPVDILPVDIVFKAPESALQPLPEEIEPWDTMFLLFTSGTTGPSKAVIVPYVQWHMTCSVSYEKSNADSRYLVNMPLFHGSGTVGIFGMMLVGGTTVLVPYFKTDEFWDVINKHQITSCVMIGAVSSFVEKQPPRDDADNPLKLVRAIPLPPDPVAFGKRFGVNVQTMFSMSEISVPLISDINPTTWESCGKVRAGIEARIVDEFDCEVPVGEVGELVLRPSRPWSITPGYYRMPEATAKAWRNGWFHTGDGFKKDADGNFYFVDRVKDAIRRRGENISSFEVEKEVLSHPDVAEAGAIGVPSPHGEDEVMIVAVLRDGAQLTPFELHEYLRPRMPHFMLPRYIRFTAELPRTQSYRVRKFKLREEGVTDDSWDREAAGIIVKRDKIG